MGFDNRLNYSLGNEDWSVEAQALRVRDTDTAICITASGDRPLHLLMTDCKQVISIDMNSIQNHLLELKMAAIALLDYEEYLAFLGCTPSRYRINIYNKIKSHLSKEAHHFWNKNTKLIARGVIYQGKIERATKLVAPFFNLLRSKKINDLFSFNDIESQREFIQAKWDTPRFKNFFKVALNPKLFKWFVNDPGLVTFIHESINPGLYIYQQMLKMLDTHLAKKSVLLQLMFLGKVLPEAYFPYLTYDGYQLIRRDMNRLKLKNDNVVAFLSQHTNAFDCFSLSDIASYMPQPAFEKLLDGVLQSAKPDARFCLREFMSKRNIPNNLTPHFQREPELELTLEHNESNFVYRFIAGTIQK